jgi:hypothetical protein
VSVASPPSPPVAPPRPSAPRLPSRPQPAAPEQRPSFDDRRFRRVVLALVGVAIALRVLAHFAHWPAFLGYPDTSFYLAAAAEGPFADPFRPGGYPAFLRVFHDLGITGTVLLQHALGLAAAALLFAVARRLGASHWTALFPAAAVALCGGQVMIEHALLSESVFVFLLTAALYACVRALDDGIGWAMAAGLLIGAAAPVRLVAVAVIPVLAVWLALALGAPLRRRIAAAAVLGVTAASVPVAWMAVNERETGTFGLTRTGAYNLYGRIAPFADCKRFDPPSGTRPLCSRLPPERRRSTYYYIFTGGSPAVAYFGHPQGYPEPDAEATRALRRFSRKAILSQPLDYAEIVARDTFRYVAPGAGAPPPGDATQMPEELSQYYTGPGWAGPALNKARRYYGGEIELMENGTLLEALRGWERLTRFSGALFVAILIPALAAPFVTRGRARAGAVLMLAAGVTLLVVPAATIFYDYRFAIPALGAFATAAALGARPVALRLRSRA